MIVRILSLLVAVGFLSAAPSQAQAAESTPVTTPHARVSLVTDTDRIADGKPFRLGLRFQVNPGWHIYWQNPGDAGQAPELDLTLPQGGTSTAIVWPTPQRIGEGPVMTYAYTGEVLLPLTVTIPNPGSAPVIQASASWLICQKICVPEEGKLTLTLGEGTPSASAQTPLFDRAAATTPVSSPFAAKIAANGVLSLDGAGLSPGNVGAAWFFPEVADTIENSAEQTLKVIDGSLTLTLKPGTAFKTGTPLDGVLVLRDPTGQETALQIDAAPIAAASSSGDLGLGLILLYAFLGGMILNLMPCVFPVLAMKAMSIARLSGAQRGEVRAHAVFYTIGVVAAFSALGGTLLILREAGQIIGWGFQFQSPAFVASMAWLLFATGLNLSGVFLVALPVTDGMVGLTDKGGHFGSFCTGLLAVLLATPCTAPFMTVALAAALAAPPAETAAVFVLLGLGLAAPYALLAIFPGLARMLPRPGNWMNWLKQILALPMYGTAIWLLWVGCQQLGRDGIIAMIFGLVVVGLAAAAFGAAQRQDGGTRRLFHRLAGGAAFLAVVALWMVSNATTSSAVAANGEDGSERFTLDRLAALRQEGRPVFIDMTAAWCVTCLVNERVALSTAATREAFSTHHVAYLKGDWTKRDPVISRFLQEHEHEGVPLYIFYPAGHGEPEILPQILSEATVADAISRSGG